MRSLLTSDIVAVESETAVVPVEVFYGEPIDQPGFRFSRAAGQVRAIHLLRGDEFWDLAWSL